VPFPVPGAPKSIKLIMFNVDFLPSKKSKSNGKIKGLKVIK